MKDNIFTLVRELKGATLKEWSEITGLSENLIKSLESGKTIADYATLEIYAQSAGISAKNMMQFNKKELTWFEKGLLIMLKGISKLDSKDKFEKVRIPPEWVKIFIGVDPQVDFITGSLPNPVAQGNVELLNKSAEDARAHGFEIDWTQDTHAKTEEEYLNTLEGKNLPLYHCGEGTDGWKFHPAIKVYPMDNVFKKPTFGSTTLAKHLSSLCQSKNVKCIVLGGYCTDICGISNALIARAVLPNVPIYWLAFASAGVTPEKHDAALTVMESCQITIIHTYEEYQELLESMD